MLAGIACSYLISFVTLLDRYIFCSTAQGIVNCEKNDYVFKIVAIKFADSRLLFYFYRAFIGIFTLLYLFVGIKFLVARCNRMKFILKVI